MESPQAEITLTWTLDELFDALEEDISQNVERFEGNYANASSRGLSMVAYEGGPSLYGVGEFKHNEDMKSLLYAANRHPRMKDVMLLNLSAWKNAGGQLYAHFASTDICRPSGCWGVLEYQDQDPTTAPKYQALDEFRRSNPIWWED